MKLNAFVIGATGWTGAEIIRLLEQHPHIADIYPISRDADIELESIHPNLTGINKKTWSLQSLPPVTPDVVFISLPSGKSQEVASLFNNDRTRIIDLGADFRFADPATFEKIYGKPHLAPALQNAFRYGYVEEFREEIGQSRLIANPGCYVNAALCSLLPLIKKNIIDTENIFISAVNGTSGAGSSAKRELLHYNMINNMLAYSLNGHRHTQEIETVIKTVTGNEANVSLVTSHGNFARGIFMILAVKLKDNVNADRQAILNDLSEYYESNPFVFITGKERGASGIEKDYAIYPQLAKVIGSNSCHISVDIVADKRELRIVSVIDNLVKGAAGTAIQNMNIMMGYNETTGLSRYGI
ncbi:N-acetyl-gamma-glutamyl-phosphate reductase [Erwinia piriflorinigrans]|uniref:N-acetyl-gamma-glutamyl-phosphate reductase n=1 Tax=Erwinia piriflorinigrans CFBP 5888 TaxID=1161919 RepID=V5ZA01_9GAMM|nr:N-acetyl-gamma-glutamyl-phosphate reductase [Erwinia piriflorinigrans]CCG88050.1 N-acetyl-gamma-glutamyl-phosphate reductase [Erwinia piriflorinigrans CFBP 5888]